MALVAIVVIIVVANSWIMTHLAWKRALQEAGFIDEMPGPSAGQRILIVAPHPDDEALGCAGLIHQAVKAGADVHVVLMTNGDASELSLIFGERELRRSPQAFIRLGVTRQHETLRAMHLLGLPASRVYFLGYPNNGLVAMWRPAHWFYSSPYMSPYTHTSSSPYKLCFTPGAAYCGQQVLADMMTLLRRIRPTEIFVVHPDDIHPDHWATYCFTRFALETLALRAKLDGAKSPNDDWPRHTQVYGYLIHWPGYPVPRSRAPRLDLLPPPELVTPPDGSPDQRAWFRLPLSSDDVAMKLRAIMAYRSQEPSFDRLLLAFARQNESFESLPAERLQAMHATSPGPLSLLPYSGHWALNRRPRRNLRGADLRSLALRIQNNLVLQAQITANRHPIPGGGYVCLDLRTWDSNGLPIITSVMIRPPSHGRSPVATALRAGPASTNLALPVLLSSPKPGHLLLSGVPLPPNSFARTRLFLSCWGSVRDRSTDPLVVTPLAYAHLPEKQ